MLQIEGAEGLRGLRGRDLGASSWHAVTQPRVSAFAEATEDDERIHLDADHAVAMGLPGTIGHGLYTLSLGPKMLYELLSVSGAGLGLNYGFDRVRFVAPVEVGSRIRMRARVTDVTEAPGGLRVHLEQRFEREGDERPACVADAVVLWRGAEGPVRDADPSPRAAADRGTRCS